MDLIALAPITTHVADAQGHLRGMYKKPDLLALAAALVGPVQDAENAVYGLVGADFIATATGVTLEKIGDARGVKRLGMTDDVMRQVILGAIAAQCSDATVADTRKTIALLFAASAVFLKQPDNVNVATAGRQACVAVGVGDSGLPQTAIFQSVAILQQALPAGVVLSRVFSFDASGALSMQGTAAWVRGFGDGNLGTTLYQNPIS